MAARLGRPEKQTARVAGAACFLELPPAGHGGPHAVERHLLNAITPTRVRQLLTAWAARAAVTGYRREIRRKIPSLAPAA